MGVRVSVDVGCEETVAVENIVLVGLRGGIDVTVPVAGRHATNINMIKTKALFNISSF